MPFLSARQYAKNIIMYLESPEVNDDRQFADYKEQIIQHFKLKENMLKREILFRGKRVDNKELVYGSLTVTEKETVYGHTTEQKCLIFESPKYSTICYNSGKYLFSEVIPETVCQYTGLNDKNNNKIFEGDKIKLLMGMNENIFEIVYTQGGFKALMIDRIDDTQILGSGIWSESEIITDCVVS